MPVQAIIANCQEKRETAREELDNHVGETYAQEEVEN
jgi:hypothetical protein